MTIFINADASRLIVQNTVIIVPPCLQNTVMYYAALLALAESTEAPRNQRYPASNWRTK